MSSYQTWAKIWFRLAEIADNESVDKWQRLIVYDPLCFKQFDYFRLVWETEQLLHDFQILLDFSLSKTGSQENPPKVGFVKMRSDQQTQHK